MTTKYDRYKDKAKKKGFRVVEVTTRTVADYGGMNTRAAKSLGFKKMPRKTIYIDKNLSDMTKGRTLKHEMCEYDLMGKGKDYFDAHRIALRKEKQRG